MIDRFDIRGRRFIAFIIDILFVVIIGAIVGFILRSWLFGLGEKANYVGFTIALLYHGLTNSLLLSGQTPGKVIFRLKVISINGKKINPIRSLFRSFMIIFIFFDLHITLPAFLNDIMVYVLMPYLVGLIYFAIFLPCNRTLHDFIFGTAVVTIDTNEINKCYISSKEIFAIIVISIILIIPWYFIGSHKPFDHSIADALKKTQAQILSMPHVKDASIGLEDGKYIISIQTIDPPKESQKLSITAASVLINNFELEDSDEPININVVRGYDLIIYHSWEVDNTSHSVHEWLIQSKKISKELK